MEKDFDLKNTLNDHNQRKRSRISRAIKQLRDEGEEFKHPQAKTLGVIPVTGRNGTSYQKHYQNKRKDDF